MIKIRALGPPLITRDGQPIALQPKRVALLMYLALTEREGMQRRDTLLGVFWPEQDATHARGSLRQALSGIRQTLGDDVLVTRGAEEVGVSPDRTATDVHAFERTLDSQTDEAIALYSAPFCQGFHLSGCPEFEHWVETERDRLARAFADAVEQTARTATAAGDHDDATSRWRRLVLLDPYSAHAAIGLMNALAAAGDRAAALDQFERYADRLRRDLDVEPEADVVVVAERLKAGTSKAVVTGVPTLVDHQSASASVQAAPRRSRLSAFSVAAVLLVIAIGGGIIGRTAGAPSDAGVEPFDANSIAVLPFRDMSGDQDQEYMSDGIAEELVNLLSGIPNLRVISRTSAFSFKGQDIDIPTVAARLNVAHVVEGSVRKAGNTIRITAQLIETQSDKHVWSQTHDRALEDIFAIQDEISAAIVEALKANLGLETPPVVRESQVVSPEAYDLYLRGLQAYGEGTVASLVSARSYFEEAIALEPTYAAAWYRLARTLIDLRVLQFQMVGEVPYEVIGNPTREAIRLDSTIGGAHTILGLLEQGRDWDLSLELRATGYQFAPGDPFVVLQYGRALEAHGRIVEAEQLFREAIRLEPLHPRFRGTLGLFLGLRGRPADGLREIERAIELNPAAAVNWTYKGLVLRLVGDLVGSTEAFLRVALDLDPDLQGNWDDIAENYLALGDLERAKTWIDRLREAEYPTVPALKVQYLSANGQGHEALKLALREFEMRGPGYRNRALMQIVVDDLIARGALDEAEEFLLHYDDGLADFLAAPVRSFTGFEPRWFSVAFARVLQDVYKRAGKTAAADALTDRLAFSSMEGRLSTVQFGWRGSNYVTEAHWHMRGGRSSDALSALERAVELGLRREWQLQIRDEPVFENISQEPRFKALIETIELDMARQREILTERRAVLVEELAAGGS